MVVCTASNSLDLLPFDRRRRLGGNVVGDAIDALDLVDDARGDALEDAVGELEPVGGHEV